jgi:hypothetical protein
MNDKVIVITREGKEISLEAWQKTYNLQPGSSRIGEYFYLTESRFKQDLDLYGKLVVNELLIRLLDAIRKASDHPLTINSFNRDEAHQAQLRSEGYRAATTSPHVAKMAADIDTLSFDDSRKLAKKIREVADIVKIKVRVGVEQYIQAGQTFVHIDVCPEYYAHGRPFHGQPHPAVWEKEIIW